MKEDKLPEEKSNAGLSSEEIQALRDIRGIRETKDDHARQRLTEFEFVHHGALPSGHDRWSLKPMEEPQSQRISPEQDLQEVQEAEELLKPEEELEWGIEEGGLAVSDEPYEEMKILGFIDPELLDGIADFLHDTEGMNRDDSRTTNDNEPELDR